MHTLRDPKILKVLPWQQLLPDTPKNLITSRSSWGKHTLKFGENLCRGIGCGTPTSIMPPCRCRRPDSTGDNYNL